MAFTADANIVAAIHKQKDDERELQLQKEQAESNRRIPRPSKLKGPQLQGMFAADNIVVPVPPKRTAPVGLLNDFILEALFYKSMYDREDEVEKAYGSTFHWVFDESAPKVTGRSENRIKEWLQADDMGPIYWITGKPGSGKSTLIEYLFHHKSAAQLLKSWSSERSICMAGFFFWTSGSREQRSQTGLLRSLLHQILADCPEYIAMIFPELWERLLHMSTKERIQLKIDWTVEELIKAFHLFVHEASKSMNICLFIDGLDEFEGDHDIIISFFKDLSLGDARHCIKMCLSSRPWAVFERAFQNAVPHLKLQDLTYKDMFTYVSEKLREDRQVCELFEKNGSIQTSLTRSAVQKADGVFLWVRLAVEQMLAHFRDNPATKTLEDTLDSLPSDLDDLFAKFLFQDQTSKQLEETANIYELLRAREAVADFIQDDSSNALTVWELAFALLQTDDQLLFEMNVEEATEQFVEDRCNYAIGQIRDRFTGLLGLQARKFQGNMRGPRFADNKQDSGFESAEKRVFYIHRTVRDWLVMVDGVHERLVESSSAGFDAHLRLVRSYVFRLKRPLEEIEHHRRLDEWWPDIALALTHARYIANDQHQLQRKFVNELNSTLSWLWAEKDTDPYDHWARNAFGSYEARMKAAPIWQPFLCLAVKFGMTQYVCEELQARKELDEAGVSDEQREHESEEATPLLAYATEFLCSRQKTIFPVSDPKLVRYLLDNQCRINPGVNHSYSEFITRKSITPWHTLLKHLRNSRRRNFIDYYDIDVNGTARWATIVQLFLEVGCADANAVVLADMWDPEIKAEEVLKLLEDTYGAIEVHRLWKLIKSLQ